MPQRTANLASVAMVAGPATPILTGQATPSPRNDCDPALGSGPASNPNWVISDACEAALARQRQLGPQRARESRGGSILGWPSG